MATVTTFGITQPGLTLLTRVEWFAVAGEEGRGTA